MYKTQKRDDSTIVKVVDIDESINIKIILIEKKETGLM